jgi:hypothetical protein
VESPQPRVRCPGRIYWTVPWPISPAPSEKRAIRVSPVVGAEGPPSDRPSFVFLPLPVAKPSERFHCYSESPAESLSRDASPPHRLISFAAMNICVVLLSFGQWPSNEVPSLSPTADRSSWFFARRTQCFPLQTARTGISTMNKRLRCATKSDDHAEFTCLAILASVPPTLVDQPASKTNYLARPLEIVRGKQCWHYDMTICGDAVVSQPRRGSGHRSEATIAHFCREFDDLPDTRLMAHGRARCHSQNGPNSRHTL